MISVYLYLATYTFLRALWHSRVSVGRSFVLQYYCRSTRDDILLNVLASSDDRLPGCATAAGLSGSSSTWASGSCRRELKGRRHRWEAADPDVPANCDSRRLTAEVSPLAVAKS